MQPSPTRRERMGGREILARIVQILSQQETTKFCPACHEYVVAVRPGTNRLRQFALSVATLGLWSIAWIIDSVRRPGWRCSRCDRRVG